VKFGKAGAAIQGDLHVTFLNLVASAIPKWRKFKLLRWVLLLNRLVDLDEILYEDDDIEANLDYILFNPVASTVSKWRTLKPLKWVLLLK
jgi:hypothetical protein